MLQPMLWLMYWLNYLDRNAIALARLNDLEEDLNLSSTGKTSRQRRDTHPESIVNKITLTRCCRVSNMCIYLVCGIHSWTDTVKYVPDPDTTIPIYGEPTT
jgi:hypothetical protein